MRVSTGSLPSRQIVRAEMDAVHARVSGVTDGRPSPVYPALERADPSLFGVAVTSAQGWRYAVGDDQVDHTLMSVSKPFVFALLLQRVGAERAAELVGVDATGAAFNAVGPVTDTADGRTNPMVNPGAIATTSHVAGSTYEERWDTIVSGLSAFAGRPLTMDEEVLASASATNLRNRTLAAALAERRLLGCDPDEALDLYTRQCCLQVTADDLSTMAATLAAGGTNPLTSQRVIAAPLCHPVLAVMVTAGLYETSGAWWYQVGLPGKSGISGALLAVSPGKGGLGVYSPPLDAAGNSVRGTLVAAALSDSLGMDILASHVPDGH